MRILIFGDTHWSTYSSILRTRGSKFSTRLENLIKSVNWVEQVSKDKNCDEVICLGDFFDRSDLTAEEISALKEINWNKDVIHHFIVGNHESGVSSLIYNSTDALNKPNFIIEFKANKYDKDEFADLYFIPYIIEDERKDLKTYLTDIDPNKKHIIFSHNDLKGVQYGAVESKEGFTIPEIEANCDYFINGHIHNGKWITSKILNLGNLTGQCFNEDAFTYTHSICILDTETLQIEFIQNPFAFNFCKIEVHTEEDLKLFDKVKPNSVISIKCLEKYVDKVKEILNTNSNIIESKTIIQREIVDVGTGETVELGSSDYLQQFYDFAVERLGKNEVVLHELSEVCK